MTVTFISNYLSPHQLPFCEAMVALIGKNYNFIATTPTNSERLSMYPELNEIYPFVIMSYKSNEMMQKAKELANKSDVVIIGSAPDSFIEERLKKGKLTFKYSERLYKKGLSLKNFPRAFISSYIHHGRFQRYPIYMLCASAFTTYDLFIFGNYKGRTFKWGYFPEYKEYDIDDLLRKKNGQTVKILWVGRFLRWKHPELVLDVAKRLENENYQYNIQMIGDGEEFDRIKNMAFGLNLKQTIDFLGILRTNEVRKYMEEADVFLFTSDFNEGWGAVLNEAMNSGCAVVASHAIGAVPFLINHGENGLVYENGNKNDLCEKVLLLANHVELRRELGKNAYFTIKNKWNARIAAERILVLAENLLQGKLYIFDDGPCSRADIIKNDWFLKVKEK